MRTKLLVVVRTRCTLLKSLDDQLDKMDKLGALQNIT